MPASSSPFCEFYCVGCDVLPLPVRRCLHCLHASASKSGQLNFATCGRTVQHQDPEMSAARQQGRTTNARHAHTSRSCRAVRARESFSCSWLITDCKGDHWEFRHTPCNCSSTPRNGQTPLPSRTTRPLRRHAPFQLRWRNRTRGSQGKDAGASARMLTCMPVARNPALAPHILLLLVCRSLTPDPELVGGSCSAGPCQLYSGQGLSCKLSTSVEREIGGTRVREDGRTRRGGNDRRCARGRLPVRPRCSTIQSESAFTRGCSRRGRC